QNDLLRKADAVEDHLADLVARAAGVAAVVDAIAVLMRKPVAVYDRAFRPIRRSRGESGFGQSPAPASGVWAHPAVQREIAGIGPGEGKVVGPLREANLTRRMLVTPIIVGESAGYVVLEEHGTMFTELDVLVARRVSTIVALALSAEQRLEGDVPPQ